MKATRNKTRLVSQKHPVHSTVYAVDCARPMSNNILLKTDEYVNNIFIYLQVCCVSSLPDYSSEPDRGFFYFPTNPTRPTMTTRPTMPTRPTRPTRPPTKPDYYNSVGSNENTSGGESEEPYTRKPVQQSGGGPPDIETNPKLALLPKKCGTIEDDRIWGGNRTRLYEMPWMALLSYDSGN